MSPFLYPTCSFSQTYKLCFFEFVLLFSSHSPNDSSLSRIFHSHSSMQFNHMLIMSKISGPRGTKNEKMNKFWSLLAKSLLWRRQFHSHSLPNPLARQEQKIVSSLLNISNLLVWCLKKGIIKRHLRCFLCTLSLYLSSGSSL